MLKESPHLPAPWKEGLQYDPRQDRPLLCAGCSPQGGMGRHHRLITYRYCDIKKEAGSDEICSDVRPSAACSYFGL